MGPTKTSSRARQGEETRRNIVRLAVDVATRHGLDSLSIGDLAKELQMSKSGLFAHFGSKEDLQIATIEQAERVFGAIVVKPAGDVKPGLARLIALLEGYIRYLERSVSGGCFFSAAAAEFDDRPGRVHDRIAESMRRRMIESEARSAVESGELESAVDPEQLAFELEAYTHHANFVRRLLSEDRAMARARHGIYQQLSNLTTRKGRTILGPKPTPEKR